MAGVVLSLTTSSEDDEVRGLLPNQIVFGEACEFLKYRVREDNPLVLDEADGYGRIDQEKIRIALEGFRLGVTVNAPFRRGLLNHGAAKTVHVEARDHDAPHSPGAATERRSVGWMRRRPRRPPYVLARPPGSSL